MWAYIWKQGGEANLITYNTDTKIARTRGGIYFYFHSLNGLFNSGVYILQNNHSPRGGGNDF